MDLRWRTSSKIPIAHACNAWASFIFHLPHCNIHRKLTCVSIVALLTGLVVLASFDFQLFWEESHMSEYVGPKTNRVLCTRCDGSGNKPHLFFFFWKRPCPDCGGTGHLVSRDRTRAVMTLERSATVFWAKSPKT